MTRNAGKGLDGEDSLSRDATASNPAADSALPRNAQKFRKSGLPSSLLARGDNRLPGQHGPINAQTVDPVNASRNDSVRYGPRVAKRAESEPSPFWKRLTEAWGEQRLPVSQNGIAVALHMSQGSTRRWFTGEGLPETETIITLARKGKVSIHWLLTGEPPKRPVHRGTTLADLLEIWERLNDTAKLSVMRSAQGEFILEHTLTPQEVARLVKSSR